MKPTVYIESSIISYLTGKPSRDLIVAAHQQITVEWWDNVRPEVDCFVSPFVIQEISRGDEQAAAKRLDAVSDLPALELNLEIQKLAQKYFAALEIPEKAKLDASHLAVAVWHEMDYLLSWNCKHIVSARVKKVLDESNANLNIKTPVLCTPEELMEV
ncbi:MAG: type II toxin-antitoxin system VapC family toxin [bacterium]